MTLFYKIFLTIVVAFSLTAGAATAQDQSNAPAETGPTEATETSTMVDDPITELFAIGGTHTFKFEPVEVDETLSSLIEEFCADESDSAQCDYVNGLQEENKNDVFIALLEYQQGLLDANVATQQALADAMRFVAETRRNTAALAAAKAANALAVEEGSVVAVVEHQEVLQRFEAATMTAKAVEEELATVKKDRDAAQYQLQRSVGDLHTVCTDGLPEARESDCDNAEGTYDEALVYYQGLGRSFNFGGAND